MSSLPWLALGAAAAVWTLPAPTVVRADGLAVGGRLTRASSSTVSRVSPGRGLVVATVALLLVVVAWRTGPALTVAAAAMVAVAALLGRDVLRARREAARRRAVLTAIRLLAAELSAGVRPADALRAAAATSDDAAGALAAVTFDDGPPVRGDDPALRGLATAWRLAATSGTALAEVVERVAADVSAREDQRRAVAVAVAGPSSSAALLSGLPLLGVALGAAMGAQPLGFLLFDPVGRVVCCAGVLLDVAGILWMRRIVGRVRT